MENRDKELVEQRTLSWLSGKVKKEILMDESFLDRVVNLDKKGEIHSVKNIK